MPSRDRLGRSDFTIDVHAHVAVPSLTNLVEHASNYAEMKATDALRYQDPATKSHMASLSAEWQTRLTDIHGRLDWMNAEGISVQVLSVNPGQYFYWAQPELAEQIVLRTNTRLADICTQNPDRFISLGTVSLQHPELVADQLDFAVSTLGMVGVQISTSANGRELSNRQFDELWAVAERLGAVIFIHPLGCPQMVNRLVPAYLNNIVGQPLETTVALSHLIFGGVLDRFPRLRLCVAHGGGYLPGYLGRSDHGFEVRPDSKTMSRPPSEYLKRIWFDSLVYRQDTLRQLINVAGINRVVLGTDSPFDMGVAEPLSNAGALDCLDEAEMHAVLCSNSIELFSLTETGQHLKRLAKL